MKFSPNPAVLSVRCRTQVCGSRSLQSTPLTPARQMEAACVNKRTEGLAAIA